MKWRIYYGDGSTFDSEDGSPEDAPGWGVIAIPQVDPRFGRVVMSRWDHYCWHEDQWWGHDLVGLMDCLACPGVNVVLHGRTIPSEDYARILALASADPSFPVRATSLRGDELTSSMERRGVVR